MFRHIITLLLCCCISLSTIAQEIKLRNNHPSQYVVVKGDTLWDIAGKFLTDPWLWPVVWNLNRDQIKNPHLIYPGDVIVLDHVNGQPRLKLLRETILNNQTNTNEVILNPEVVIEPLAKHAIPSISLHAIAPFLNQPLIIEKDQLKVAPSIIAGPDNRVILSPSTKIYIDNIQDKAAINWHIYRKGEALIDPETKTNLGYEAHYLGDAIITKYGDPATGEIVKAKEEIFVKDRLVPFSTDIQTSFTPHAPVDPVNGKIINIYNSVTEAAAGSIVSINRGYDNGIEIGHVLAIKSQGRTITNRKMLASDEFSLSRSISNLFTSEKELQDSKENMIKLPDERAGLLMIFRVFKHVAYGLVMQTELPVNQFDTVTNP